MVVKETSDRIAYLVSTCDDIFAVTMRYSAFTSERTSSDEESHETRYLNWIPDMFTSTWGVLCFQKEMFLQSLFLGATAWFNLVYARYAS